MSRKPVNIVADTAGGKPYGRRAVWGAIRELQVFTRVEIKVRLPHVSNNIIKEYLQSLMRGGFVEAGAMIKGPNLGASKVRQYKLVRDIGVDAPRLRKDGRFLPPTGQQQMWLAMKIMGAFDAENLAAASSTGEVMVNQTAARDYIKHLQRAGYLAEVGEASGLYKLVNNTGGYAPMVQRSKVVFDPNCNKIVWHEDIEP